MSRWKEFVDMLVRKLKVNRGQTAFRQLYIPATRALVLARYAPTVTGSVAQLMVPLTASLTASPYAPTVTKTVDNPITVTPTTRALATARFAPVISKTNLQTATPTTKALTLTRHVPVVTPTAPRTAVPPKLSLTLTKYAPTVIAAASGSGYPPDTTLKNTASPTPPAIPAYLTPYNPPDRPGIQITRVSNVHGQRNQYSRIAGWNSDSTMILLSASDIQPVPCILNGSTYAKMHDLPFLVGFAQWSNTDPNKIYGTWTEENYLRSQTWNGSSWTLNIEHTFSDYVSISLGDGEGGLSDDDDTIVLMTRKSNGEQGMLVYDRSSDSIVATRSFGSSRPDTCFVSRGGNYALVYWSVQPSPDGPGTMQGLWQYDRNLTLVRQLTQYARHGDVCRLADGTEAWAQVAFGGEVYNLDTGALTQLFAVGQPYPYNNAFSLGHCSGRATGRNGWVYFSNYNYTGASSGNLLYGRDQIIAAKLDGSKTIEEFGWSYHRNDGQSGTMYPTSPFATPSRDGKKVLWGSEWGDTTAPYSPVYAYISEKA